MGREVRHVSKDWVHPKENGTYLPLYEGYKNTLSEFMVMLAEKGLQETLKYFGRAPNKYDYMPDWSEKERTHYQMYETVSEGTPISPVMGSPESLAMWLHENDTDYSGLKTNISYEAWLRVCNDGYAPTFVVSNGKIIDGVTDAFEQSKKSNYAKEI